MTPYLRDPDVTLYQGDALDCLRELLAAGKRPKAIGPKLDLAEETVKHRLQDIRRRFRARNTTHAVAMAIRTGVIE